VKEEGARRSNSIHEAAVIESGHRFPVAVKNFLHPDSIFILHTTLDAVT
jgi:hypothetical protein